MMIDITYKKMLEVFMMKSECRMKTFAICGVTFHNLKTSEALCEIESLLLKKNKARVCFLNFDCLYKAQKDDSYKEALNSADLLLPDGVGLRVAVGISGGRVRENCNGTDLSPDVVNLAVKHGLRVFFLGGKEGVAHKAALNIQKKIPSLKIAGFKSGYFTNDDEAIKAINESQADILFVAMGVPLQDMWIVKNRDRLNPRLCLGVGALLDYWSGSVRRAPKLLRLLSLEWFWRILIDPKRMVKRYLIDGVPFLMSIVRKRFRP